MAAKLRKLTDVWHANKGAQRYFFNISWMLVERVLRVVSSVLVGIYVARFLGPDKFGIYSYVLAFFSIASIVSRLGLNHMLVREIILAPEKRDLLFGTAFWMTVGGALLSIAALAVITTMIGTDPTTRIYILIVGCGLIFQAFDVVEAFFNARVIARPVSIAGIMQLLLSSILKLFLVWQQADLVWFVLVSVFDQMTLAGFMILAYTRHASCAFMRLFDLAEARHMLSRAWIRIVITLSTILYLRIDQIMLMEMQGGHSAGLYASAARVTEATFMPILVVAGALLPALLGARTRSRALYNDRLQRFFFLMTWLGIGAAVTVGLASGWIMSLFGSAYREAVLLLVVHVMVLVPFSQWIVLQRWALAEDLEGLIMKFLVVGAILNVLLNLLLVRQYGAVGAAAATVISQCAITYVAPLFHHRSRATTFMLYRSFYKWKV
jgi:O-antigen/teichoic acid export membrane protein